MATKEALREGIELLGRLVSRGKPVRVVNLRPRGKYALADFTVDGVRLLNKKFAYTKTGKIRSFN